MPGAPEIDKLVRQLQTSRKLLEVGGRGVRVLPLHGGLPPSVQSKVFERPPKGVLKVIVATNVAETSLTIDDVTVVIDTGRHKEMRYAKVPGGMFGVCFMRASNSSVWCDRGCLVWCLLAHGLFMPCMGPILCTMCRLCKCHTC